MTFQELGKFCFRVNHVTFWIRTVLKDKLNFGKQMNVWKDTSMPFKSLGEI